MKKVITYGTFDLLHAGHINILRRARELGDYLIVVLSTDEFNAIKNKKAYYSYEDRKLILEAIRYVDEVVPVTEENHEKMGFQRRKSNPTCTKKIWQKRRKKERRSERKG